MSELHILDRIDPLRASILCGVIYTILGLILWPFFLIGWVVNPAEFDWTFFAIFSVLLPLFYGVIGFLSTFIFCLLYNALAKRIGGFKVEFSLEGRDADASPASHE